ncbi:gephyrin-like molybdotransferase Glp [Haloechinothrix sp. LS1_15]|uniref:molybdopterin molybdotransferase MoeA n=1 Tax=Haloechinothrix sp. LS1_15 TaxID=2652248 RepID=UPI002948714D|nr:gephyrin-like molybdotransferase Glp [Haloechinothrix sp. LS1_15]MDV6014411.1 molybdopterin molybdotransferase MoeA [Haloechinothrix sp. LS1_15]
MTVSVAEHRAAVRQLVPRAPAGTLPLEECHGLVLAEDVTAGVALPPFDNSAMDGYAVRASDIMAAGPQRPVRLPVAADIPAGRTDVPELVAGTAHRIMTGAPVPRGADAVVRVEDTDAATGTVAIHAAAEPGANIRRAGEDIARGARALTSGTVLGAAQLGLAAATGRDSLTVRLPPRVLVVSTGTELVTPPAPLADGQIYESNGVMLAAALRGLGCRVELMRAVSDDVAAFTEALTERATAADLIVTSGGVSAGAYEVVKDALAGEHVTFTKVAMQPGGPQGCGTLHGVPIVTLPGNPVSVLVSYEVFLRPALLAALGHPKVERPTVRARLLEPLKAPAGKRQFRRGHYTEHDDPRAAGATTGTVEPRGGPGSHLLAAFTEANCLIVVAEDVTEVAEGEEVEVLLLD